MKRFIIPLMSILWLSSVAMAADSVDRVKHGFGQTLSAVTTPQEMVIRQTPNSDVVSNGTFASDIAWTKGTDWTIAGGYGVFTTSNMLQNGTFANTNWWKTNSTTWLVTGGGATFTAATDPATNNMFQLVANIVSGKEYQVEYTVSGLVETGSTYICFLIGQYATGTVYGTNGTYLETVTALESNTNFYFRGYTTNIAGTVTVDNVYLRLSGSETNDIYQTYTNMVKGTQYRVKYTVAGLDPGTNTLTPYLGSNPGTTVTTSGTYTADIYSYGASQILFRAVATNTSTFTIDNITMSELADEAYVDFLQLSVGPTDMPMYFILNGNGTDFTNSYTESTCMIVTSNGVLTINDLTGEKKVSRLWYRTASGTATAIFNGN